MKRLIFINGTMGVGKTTVGKILQQQVPNCVFLDGDWCWNTHPFLVTTNTKAMVLQNICFLLQNFLRCPDYDNVVFCWVLHEQATVDCIVESLNLEEVDFRIFTLLASPKELERRILHDVQMGVRERDVLQRSLARQPCYENQNTVKIDTSALSPLDVAQRILKLL